MIRVTAPKDRAVRLASTTGAAAHLAPGETRVVPAYFSAPAAEQGCAVQPVDGAAPAAPAPDQAERAAMVQAAIQRLLDRGEADDFTGSGRPRVTAVRAELNDEVTSAEVNAAYDALVAGD